MSHYIPFDIQEKIIKSLPVRSLIQFRSVSKQWMIFIDSLEFINDCNVRHTEPRCLIISKTKPTIINPRILRTRGLLSGSYRDTDNKVRGVLWNPLNRKSVGIDVPSVVNFTNKTVVGFGVCRHTNDPKLVKITNNPPFIKVREDRDSTVIRRVWKVETFTLRSGTWKRERQCFIHNLDEFIYWLAFDGRTEHNAEFEWYDLIMSIDMTSEEFTQESVHHSLRDCTHHSKMCEVSSSCKQPCSGHSDLLKKEGFTLFESMWRWVQTPWISWPKGWKPWLPEKDVHHSHSNIRLPFINKSLATQAGAEVDLFISNLRKYLANEEAAKVYYIWIKENSVPKSFSERFDYEEQLGCIKKVYGERNYGESTSDGSGYYFEEDALFIYKPHSHEINSIRIFGKRYSFFACRKQDQLFLLDN